MLRSPDALFEPSKAYALNYDAMKKIKPEMWSQALNDPTWIRNVFELMLTSVSFYWLPHRRKNYVGIEHQFEKPYKICHGTPSPSTTLLRNIITQNLFSNFKASDDNFNQDGIEISVLVGQWRKHL